MNKQVSTKNAPDAIGPYSQAVIVGDTVFCSGQIPIVPQTGNIIEGDITVQTEQVFKNISAVLQQAGTSLQNVCKTTVFLKNMSDFAAMNAVYAKAFGECVYPARSAVEVASLPKGALVEIEVIAKL